MNINLNHIEEYRLEILTSNMSKCEPVFCNDLKEAKKRKKELIGNGYKVTIFKITQNGNLVYA